MTLHAINKSIREIPVTISEFKIGMLVIPSMTVLPLDFMALIPMEAAVPIIVARTAETRAIKSVL